MQIGICVIQYASVELFQTPPVDLEKQTVASKFEIVLTIVQTSLAIPQILPSLSQIIFKLFMWPLDLKNFAGKCTFKLAFPGYPYGN